MSDKHVYIRYIDGKWGFADLPNGDPNSADPVRIRPNYKVKWKALHDQIAPFTGFEVNFRVDDSPFPGHQFRSKPSSPGSKDSNVDSDPANSFGRFKYSVTLTPAGPSLDPEVRVEDSTFQSFETALCRYDADAGKLITPDMDVYEGDLLRFAIEEDPFEDVFEVSFTEGEVLYLPTTHSPVGLRSQGPSSATFYCQVRPAQREMSSGYRISIPSRGLSAEGRITVHPRPEPTNPGALRYH